MFILLLIILVIFTINYFLLIFAIDNNERNNFRYSIVADIIKRINLKCDDFKELWSEYNNGSVDDLSKINRFCFLRIFVLFVLIFILICLRVKFGIRF